MPERGGSAAYDRWLADLERRHFAELTFPEVSRALRALSATYVERRRKIAEGAALAGAGKRAAFAMFYGPLHFLLVTHIVHELPGVPGDFPTLVDLGCGTGASGAAWALACARARGGRGPRVAGVDRHPWALSEAAQTYRTFGLRAAVHRGDAATAALPSGRCAILAAFTVNELDDRGRGALLERLLDRGSRGDRILIVEPIAGPVARWWARWREAFEAGGGRSDEWRFRPELPAIVAKLDRAAGLDHREISGRSLWLAPRATAASRAAAPSASS
jgi:hypothetical protein